MTARSNVWPVGTTTGSAIRQSEIGHRNLTGGVSWLGFRDGLEGAEKQEMHFENGFQLLSIVAS